MGEYITYVWLGVILLALAVEFMSMDLSSIWFAVGGVVALIVSFIMPNQISGTTVYR
jgi:membrane-bound ClpP family serine protease